MKARLKYILIYYLFWVLLFIIQKPVFLLFQWKNSFAFSISEWINVVVHGFPMDLSAAGYMTVLVAVLLLASSFFYNNKWLGKIIFYYTAVVLFLVMLICVADLYLYSFWGFRIDSTPLFYLESPKNALASGSWEIYLTAFLLISILYIISFWVFRKIHRRFFSFPGRSFWSLIPISLFGGILFIFIRGGVGVSTMNAGRVYFSKSIFLNHAAINPVWNFIYSFSKNEEFDKQYRFMEPEKAASLFKEMVSLSSDSTDLVVLKNNRPNIVFIVLEGIGSNVCEALGGEKGVTPNLDKLSEEGISFTRFYANSFRTDRGLIAILSGYPGQPATSLMKYPNKSQHVPKIPLSLKNAGYDIAFYYGGDENFTNLRSYLLTSGFEKIVSEKDFSSKELSTKWGAYDHVLFDRVTRELEEQKETPFFKLILTLSSHEPYDVPMKKLDDPYLNSVAYADSCLGVFISDFKKSRFWDNSLVVILPDHASRYPESMTSSEIHRFQIPMWWIGGVIEKPMKVEKIASQIDLARTLLVQLGLDASEYNFSKDIFGTRDPEFAFYAFNNGFGVVVPEGASIYDCDANVALKEDDKTLTGKGKAFLQSLFDDLAKR